MQQRTCQPCELSRRAFVAELDELTGVYLAAMQPDPGQIPSRRTVMERHASNSGFRALAVRAGGDGTDSDPTAGAGTGGTSTGGTSTGGTGTARAGGATGARRATWAGSAGRAARGVQAGSAGAGSAGTGSPAAPGQIVGFSYGFTGDDGQWWHDVVFSALTAVGGMNHADAWLADSLEVAEVHVLPAFQHRGIGKTLVLGLAAGRREHTAVLSTPDRDSTARRLYRGLGFADLLTGYTFPGADMPYAVMGAVLPLADRLASPRS